MQRRRLTALVGITAVVAAGAVALDVAADAVGADTTAPTASSVQLLPGSVDITRSDGQATAVLRVQDTAPVGVTPSGFASGSITLSHGGTSLNAVDFTAGDRVNGTPLDGTYDVSLDVPQTSPAGVYSVSLSLTDVSGATQATTPAATLTVTRTADAAAPTLAGPVTATPSAVTTTTSSTDVEYSAHVTDNVSGALSVVGVLSNGDELDFAQSSGTTLDGIWQANRTFSPTDTTTVTLTSLQLTDLDGNTVTVTAGLGGTVTVTHQHDTTLPGLTDVTLSTNAVNVSAGSGTVTATAAVTDNLSGVDNVSLTFTDADGDQIFGISGDLASGSRTHGAVAVAVDVPFQQAAGTYALSEVDVSDRQGNVLMECSDSSCGPPPPARSVQVTSNPDTQAPTVSALGLGPDPATGAYGPPEVDGTVTAADATSGVASATVTLQSGAKTVTADASADTLRSGTIHSGTFGFSTSELSAGTWTVASVAVTDNAGNTATVTTAQLTSLGAQTTITVNSLQNDSVAPLLTALSLSPASVDTTGGRKDVTLSIAARDPDADHGQQPSGLSPNSSVVYTPDSGTGQLTFFLDQLVAGNDVNGTWTSTQSVSKFAASGAWHATEVDLQDNAGHQHRYLPADLAAAHVTAPVLTVTSTPDTTAPVLTGVTVPAGTLTGSSDLSAGGPVAHIGISFTDTGAGVTEADVTVSGPGGQQFLGTPAPTDPSLNGTTDVPITLPQFNATGQWKVTEVDLLSGEGPGHDYDVGALGAQAKTFAVATPSDTAPPTVSSIAVTPASVNTSSAAVDASVILHVTDAGSGVGRLTVNALSPHSTQHLTDDLSLIAGTTGDGYWQGTLSFPRYVDPGSWALSLSGFDAIGNQLNLTSAQLAAAGLTATVPVTGPVDSNAPALTGLAVTPATADTTTGDKTFTLTAHATDGESGVAGVSVGVNGPSGTTDTVQLTPTAGGTPAAAVLTGTYLAPAFSAVGAWTFGPVVVTDVYGNTHTYTTAQLSTAGFATGFTLTGTPDVTNPTLTGVALSASSVDVSSGGQSVTATVTATDNASGVRSGSLTYSNGGHDVTAFFDTSNRTGSPTAATFTVQLNVPQYTAPGAYTLSDVELTDQAGNNAAYSSATLPAAGVARTLTVGDAHPDVTPPTVVSVTPTPNPLDVHTTAQNLSVAVRVTDGASGFESGEVEVVSPSGQSNASIPFDASQRTSGTAADGMYTVTLPFPTNAETGTWKVSVSTVSDQAGNASAGPTPAVNLSVTGAPTVPAAPSSVNAEAGNTSAVVSWDQPVNGGSPITGYVVTPIKAGVAQPAVQVNNLDNTVTISGLINGASYTFTVAAKNAKGTGPASAPSNAVTPNPTAPGAPSAVVATPGDGTLSVTWNPPADTGGSPVTGYVLQTFLTGGAFVSTQSVGAATTSAAVTGLTNGVSYHVVVRAVNAIGQGDGSSSNDAAPTATPPTLPGAPTAVGATVAGTTATVTWTAPANDGHSAITHYVITPFDAGVAGAPVTVGAVPPGQVGGLTKGHTYTFKVAAQNAVGNGPQSDASAPVTVPATAPAAPAAPTATLTGRAATVTFTPPGDTGGSPVTGYVITPFANGVEQPVVNVASSPAQITGLTVGTSFQFTVAAKNAVNVGAQSPKSNAVTPVASAPGAPTGVAATLTGVNATVSWTPPVDNGGSAITGYTVTPFADGVAQPVITVAGGVTSTTDSGLTPGASYTFTVTATNAVAGSGAASAASAPVVPRVATKLALGSATSKVVFGSAARVTGTLTRNDTSAGVAGVKVTLQFRTHGKGSYKNGPSATSSATGTVSLSFKPSFTADTRLVTSTGGAFTGATSAARTVSLSRKITISVSATSVKHGKSFKVSGTVGPKQSGKAVVVQRKSGSRWVTVATGKESSKGAYGITVRTSSKGTFTYRVSVTGDSVAVTSTSASKSVRVT